jgi:hypothetical protein
MHPRPRLVLAITGAAASLLIPLIGTQAASAAPHTKTPTCIVHSAPSQVETGAGIQTSSIADVIEVACHPVFAEQMVEISSPQLSDLCNGTLSWETSGGLAGFGDSFDVRLDDDGNATAVVWGGPSCAAGRALISADLTVAPFTTATTHFMIEPPATTPPGITAVPSTEHEDATYSDAATVLNIEFPSHYGEDTVKVSSSGLFSRCHGDITWVGADETVLGIGVKSVRTTLDDDGNAFVVALAGPSCATGTSTVTARLVPVSHGTQRGTFDILAPAPVNP